jgi:TRAP-type C4-dicarboxylate transport system permease small subunit
MVNKNDGMEKQKQTDPIKNRKSGVIVKIDRILSQFEIWITVGCFCLMCVIVIAGIVMRFILKIPNQYGEEISRYLMICGIFVGVSIGVRKKAHLGVTIIVEKLPFVLSKIISIIAAIITLGAYLILTFFGFRFVLQMNRYGQTSPAMGLPMWIIYFTIFFGLLLSTVRAFLLFLNDYIAKDKILEDEKKEDASWSQ